MRTIGGLVLVLVVTAPAYADPGARSARIAQTEIEVRSGPSPIYYATSKLRQGDVVVILREEEGWLAIAPPSPDSFSWVNMAQVEVSGRYATVTAAEARIRVGSRLLDQPPSVERIKVSRGALLMVIGYPKNASDGRWLPILPAPTEVRYIPADAVQSSPQPQLVATANAKPAPAAFNQPGFSAPAVSPAPSPVTASSNPAWSDSNPVRASNAAVTSNSGADNPAPAAAPIRPNPTSAFSSWQPSAPVQPTSVQYCYVPDPCYAVRLRPPILDNQAPQGPPPHWSSLGTLYRAAFMINGRQAYRLDPINPNEDILYVTAAEGVNLEAYTYKVVNLYGPVGYFGQLKKYYMIATHVQAR